MDTITFTKMAAPAWLLAMWKEIDDKTFGKGFDCFAEDAVSWIPRIRPRSAVGLARWDLQHFKWGDNFSRLPFSVTWLSFETLVAFMHMQRRTLCMP